MTSFEEKVKDLIARHEALITRKNEPVAESNGVYTRYKYPVLTAAHTPIFWRYDLDEKTNPYLMERIEKAGTLDPHPLNQWRFVPEEWVKPAAERDRKVLFE